MIGSLLAGRFRLIEKMGEGRVGEVYLAEHEALRRHYTIKVLKRDLMGDERFVERFRNQALATSRLEHPNIVYVVDFGQSERDMRFYLVMEYIPGTSLREELADIEPDVFRVAWVCEILKQVASALDAAHLAGVVHCDLKPEHILLREGRMGDDLVKILDFGLAGMVGDYDDPTAAEDFVGTPAYMSPEQIKGMPVDNRADIYAFGVLAYELFGGRLPFVTDNDEAMKRAHLFKTPPPITDVRPLDQPSLPAELVELTMRCLAKQRDERPSSASELRHVLSRVQKHLEGEQRSSVLYDAPMPSNQEIVDHWSEGASQSGIDELPPIPRHAEPSQAAQIEIPPGASREWLWNHLCKQAKELAGHVTQEGLADHDLIQVQESLQRIEEDVVIQETELALLQSQLEDLSGEMRERESRLRHALIDLSMQRSRVSDSSLEGDTVADSAFDEQTLSVEDLDYQISELEHRLHELRGEHAETARDIEDQVQAVEDALADCLRTENDLELKLIQLLGRVRPRAWDRKRIIRSYRELEAMLKAFSR